jgi:23S rRNA-/tRNA-specific pseudouridylate synthase
VEVFSARPPSQIEVLSEEGGVLAVRKPAELPTEPDRSGADCVLAQLARQLRLEPSALFAISRLDVGVSGVLLVTLGSRSREQLLAERQQGRLKRRYVAVAAATPQPSEGDWRESLGGARAGKRAVAGRDAQSAHTHYRVVASARPLAPGGQRTSLLALSPVTGRTHQLRAHAAVHAAPLLGDRKYGGPARLTAANGATRVLPQILLHSAWVEWGEGPRRRRVTCEPAPALVETWLELGGESVDLQHALD